MSSRSRASSCALPRSTSRHLVPDGVTSSPRVSKIFAGAEQHVRHTAGLLVDEADPAPVEQTGPRRSVELPGPRPATLAALNRQVLFEAFLLERDRLRTERGRAVRAVFVAAPRSGAGGGERDGRELGGETEARVRHFVVRPDAGLRTSEAVRLWRTQRVPQKCRRRACAVRLLSAGELSQKQQADESHPKGGKREATEACGSARPMPSALQIAAVRSCSPRLAFHHTCVPARRPGMEKRGPTCSSERGKPGIA